MIIRRYLTREVINMMLAVTMILLIAFLCQQVVRYFNYVAIGKIPTNILLILVGFEIPYLLALLLPLGLYLGIILAYGRLYSDNEMAILKLSGFGFREIMRLTLLVATMISLFILVLMLWVNPLVSAKRQQLMASDEATLHLIQTLSPGRFQVSPDGRHVMYVEKLSRDHQRAKNVFLAQEKKSSSNEQQKNWMLVLASQGYQVKDKTLDDQFFVTTDGYRYEGTPGENDYKIIQFKKYWVRIPQNDTRIMREENEVMPTLKLWQEYENPKRASELQWRFSIALSAFLLAVLAVPLSTVRPRRGKYLMLLPAILVYIVYIDLLFVARHWTEQGTVPVTIGMWWVHGIFLLAILLTTLFSAQRIMAFKRT